MKKFFRGFGASFLAALLVFPAAVQGEITGQAIPVAQEKPHISAAVMQGSPRKDMSPDPADYPLVEKGGYIGNLLDSQSNSHSLYLHDVSDYTADEMDFILDYESTQLNAKDGIVTVEFYSNINGTIQFLDFVDFNTYGQNSLLLSAYVPKDFYSGSEYIYARIGVSSTGTEPGYSADILFKTKNPFYSQTSPVQQTGKYAIISNESVNPDITQSSGTIKLNTQSSTFSPKLGARAFKINPTLPFDVEKNSDNEIEDTSSKSLLRANLLGSTKYFWVYDFVTESEKQINARLAYSGTKANVWVYNKQISDTDASRLGTEFDAKIYQTIANNFGRESDVNKDGKISILVYDINDGFDGSGSYVGGYFYGGDLYDIGYSNKSEIFYVDTYPSMGTGTTKDVTAAYSTLVHEFQHMVNFNQSVFVEGQDTMDVWLDEGLSMAAEQIYSGRALSDRIAYYNYSNSIANGHSLLYWDDYGDVLSNYSLSYLFTQYTMLQAGIGNGVYKEILANKYNDYRAVEAVVKKYIDPGMTFGKFMTKFRTALLLKRDKGLEGFKGADAFDQLQPMVYNGTYKSLRGGGAVIKPVTSDSYAIPADKGTSVSYTIVDMAAPTDITPPAKPAVNQVDDNDTSVTGTAEKSSIITVKAGRVVLGKGTAYSTGAFNIKIPAQKAGVALSITASDNAANESAAASVTVIDKTAPAKPIVNQVKDYDKAVTGKAEAGSIVRVKLGTAQLGYATANAYGNFTVPIVTARKAGTILTVTATDKVGNISSAASGTVVDKTPPAKPAVNQVKDYDKVVTGKAEPGAVVRVRIGTALIGYAYANSYGNFSAPISIARKAGTVLSVTASDKAGNTSTAASVTIVDKTAPGIPSVNAVANNLITVTGKAEPRSTIKVRRGTTLLSYAVADAYGKFTVRLPAYQKPGTILTVTATDKAGNTSKAASRTVVDKIAPAVPVIYKVTSRSASVNGKAEALSLVIVKRGTTLLGSAYANKYGYYSVRISRQRTGTYLYVYAKDKAGNLSRPGGVRVSY